LLVLSRISLLAIVALGVLAAPASAASHGPALALPAGLLGIDFPSVHDIVRDVVRFFFGTLLDALVPPFLRHAALGALRWLIAVPNPADRRLWPTVGTLADDLRYVGIGLLPLTFTLSALRHWIGGLAGRDEHAGLAVVRTAGACAGVVAYSWAFFQCVAAINVVTNAILSFPVVDHGLQRTVGLLFGGTLLTGSSVFLAVLGICAVVLATGLFAMKVAVTILFALWYVTGAFLLALSPLPEAHAFWRIWKFGFVALAAIPIGWCILFALAGAFALDVTGAGLTTGGLGSKLIGAFATLIVFYLALRWPMIVLGQLKSRLGPGIAPRGGSAGGAGGGRTRVDTATAARARLARATLAGGHMVASRLPAGGLVGLGARAGRAAAPVVAAVASRFPSAPAAAGPPAVAGRAGGAVRQRGRVAMASAVAAATQGEPAPRVVAAAVEAATHVGSHSPSPGRRGPRPGRPPTGNARSAAPSPRAATSSPAGAAAAPSRPGTADPGSASASQPRSSAASSEAAARQRTHRDSAASRPASGDQPPAATAARAVPPAGAVPVSARPSVQESKLAADQAPHDPRGGEVRAAPPTPARGAAEAASRPGRPRKPRGARGPDGPTPPRETPTGAPAPAPRPPTRRPTPPPRPVAPEAPRGGEAS
jgi:hypothetical protein